MKIDKSNWSPIKLADVTIKKEENNKTHALGSFDKFLKVEHLDAECLHIKRWGKAGEEELPPTFYKVFRKGQILYPTRNPHLKRVALASFDGICGEKTLTLEPIRDLVDDKFYPFIFLAQSFIDHTTKAIVGSTNPHVRWRDVAEYTFLLPSRRQQIQLAELLWAADVTMEAYKRLLLCIETYQTVYGNTYYQDKKRPLNTILSIAKINPPIPKKPLDPDLEVSFLAMADISEDGRIINMQKRKLKDVRKGFTYFGEGDTLFAKITPCMENGKGALTGELMNNIGFGSTEFHVIRPSKESDKLYCYFLSTMRMFRMEAEKLMVGSAGQKRVPSDFFEFFSFHVPNEKQRQKFGETMKRIEMEKEKLFGTLKMVKRIQNQLLNQIFSIS